VSMELDRLKSRCQRLETQNKRIEARLDSLEAYNYIPSDGYKAVHCGFGKWKVTDPEGEVLNEGMTKIEAINMAEGLETGMAESSP
jgi:hypothetical protein